ncbi:MAG: cysteine--tRNA ligase [Holosporales bacterium]|nr:cysteine--tRNA ligase [Holosporales bacterium]
MSRKKEIFVPKEPQIDSQKAEIEQYDNWKKPYCIKMYVCGPTVYDFAHLGNARAMVAFDVLYRLLRHMYASVIYVRNITDIDDKIYTASLEKQCHFSEIARKFEIEFLHDMHKLNVYDPTYSPRATEFIDQMMTMIARLINKGFAYEANGHVLFEVSKYSEYGKLSSKTPEELLAGARVEVATYKKNPCDFVLWKPSHDNVPGWDSPWGYGRPGWHIECSAMSYFYLGDVFDIHAGGIDLIFPHHENERAQSCGALGVSEMARFWLHNGHLMINGKKMSKSLGNFFTVRELLEKYPAEVIRLTLISTHYRQPLDWTYQLLIMAQQLLNKWYRILCKQCDGDDSISKDIIENPKNVFDANIDRIQELGHDFFAALCDDMNTPIAIQCLNQMIQEYDKTPSKELFVAICYCGHILGILFYVPHQWFQSNTKSDLDEVFINAKIDERAQAKRNKNFALSDKIRDELFEHGIVLEDSAQGTSWRRNG